MSAQTVEVFQSVKVCDFCAQNLWGRWKHCECEEE